MMNSEINLPANKSTAGASGVFPVHSPVTFSLSDVWSPPKATAANCIVTLQICSTNQLHLTWGTSLTTGMIRNPGLLAGCHQGPRWERNYNEAWNCVLLLALCVPVPLFSTSVLSILSLADVVTRCDCWRQSQKSNCLGWETRNSSCPIFH